jgi:hypothetical protein
MDRREFLASLSGTLSIAVLGPRDAMKAQLRDWQVSVIHSLNGDDHT